ncbi:MAG: HAD hydrolase-like protein [Spirochaetales bacterium]|jgi:phosphoglycolate phosphatase|nr:HAD hydrolase-like protein [Spirochaetales bacterium]
MKYTHVLFDLDGTLTDPFEGVVNSLRFALARFGIREEEEAVFRQFIGPPLEKTFRDYYRLSADDTQRAVGYYREYYAEKGVYENKLYEGIDGVLQALRNKNIHCSVATSKLRESAVKALQNFHLDAYFLCVAGSRPDGTLSEKEDIIRFIISEYKPEKNKTIMVGDRKYDIEGARKNGIESAAVSYGYGSREELEKENPAYFCDSPRDLLRVLI